MNKILVITGPTATGKTGLGLKLAKKLNGEILSADSRQVFQGMDIITGKDLPVKSKNQKSNVKYDGRRLEYWETPDKVNIWLLDLVEPTQDFSVAAWQRAARKVAKKLWKQKKLPVIVGGTGLYIKALVDGIETLGVPQNKRLRARLVGKTADELYAMLEGLDSVRAASLNRSDRRNPRRLVRAIEIAQWKWEVRGGKVDDEVGSEIPASHFQHPTSILMVGLTAPREALYERIDKRVMGRIKGGAGKEIEELLLRGVSWEDQAMTGLGYRQLRDYFGGEASFGEAVLAWKSAEHQYSRQQLTWFKRDKRINWFDTTKKGWEKDVEKLVKNWYDKSDV